ncbi:type II toxin-antitoxin system HipA family toxin [Erythrobacter aureus]|uniref:Type II toxin-antitoxin system HipA family toxin n=1 Tax=Erythrobacter aureus TaxID=2182384 RepID=A0A345YED1_9SPHN|nr:type II toxin-antitoxin system HipA family toxin [Erythrobacter aureus]AXK42283.1 type II toxin-antitoxin system HipA family toxin [Erythrobacter aureus]
MPRQPTHPPLSVYLNNRLVGRLRRQANGAVDFQYDEGWLAWEHAMPVSNSLQLREDRYVGAPVIAVFDNLLPDNRDIRSRVAEKMGAKGTDAYSLLSAVGRDCVGALQFLPDGEEPSALDAIEGEEIAEAGIAEILSNLKAAPLGLERERDFRISIAGAQEKTALTHWKGKWLLPHGTTPTTHIFKPQIGELPNGIDLSNSVENEFLCLEICRNFGIPTTECEIQHFEGKPALIVQRFDREIDGDRILRQPQEDMCQAMGVPPDIKYQSDGGPSMFDVLTFLRGSDTPTEDQANFLKANILFWLLGATDGHAKNFSVAMGLGGRFSLTPLYDVLSAEPSFADGKIPQGKYRLAMSVGKNRHYRIDEIMPRHFMQTADRAGFSVDDARALFEQIKAQAEEVLQTTFDSLPNEFPSALVDGLSAGFIDRLRLLEHLD